MKARDVVILREVADDLNDGKAFYDKEEPDIGDYFWESLLADIESLTESLPLRPRDFGLLA